MGGLLAADVALLTPIARSGHGRPSRHRILGVVGLDAPFLGMHPSVVVSGLGSLFKGKPERSDPATSETREQDSTTSNASLSAQDLSDMSTLPLLTPEISATSTSAISSTSNLNTLSEPDLQADTFLTVPNATAEKPTTWSRALYFINKHSDNVTKASKAYLTSHLEFGGCMADYHGLIDRYDRIRALEDRTRERVRFVNYYTATTGRPKRKDKEESINPEVETWANHQAQRRSSGEADSLEGSVQRLKLSESIPERPQTPNSRLSVSSCSTQDPRSSPRQPESGSLRTLNSTSQTTLATLPPDPVDDTLHPSRELSTSSSRPSPEPSSLSCLPPIPPRPSTPPPFDPSTILNPTPSALKSASRAHEAQLKAHKRANKERDKAILSQRKALAKAAKKASKNPPLNPDSEPLDQKPSLEEPRISTEKQTPLLSIEDSSISIAPAREAPEPPKKLVGESDSLPSAEQAPKPAPQLPTDPSISSTASNTSPLPKAPPPLPPRQPPPLATDTCPIPDKKPKHRHFCLLPRKDARGERDRCWVRVVMQDVDEVGAHCGLFAAGGGHYAWFVGEVVRRVGGWAAEGSR